MLTSVQLKNMINSLFSSQSGGTKSFCNDKGTGFGWKAIFDLYTRECSRRDVGTARMVPKLRESYVLRDSWTKLNVMPAKIMQVSLLNCFYVFLVSLYFCLARSFVRVVQPH